MMKSNYWLALKSLVNRNIKIFMKDKTMVFFSILAPVLVLLLYILFLGKMQITGVRAELYATYPDLVAGLDDAVVNRGLKMIIDNWMIAGVVGISCITVSFSSCTSMVRDRAYGTINDVFAAPIPKWVVFLSYILSGFFITFFIVMSIFMVGLVYLACTGGLSMSFVDFLAIFGTIILSILSASFCMVLIVSFIRSEGALTSFNSVFSALIGFLTGSYMPVGMLPQPVQIICGFVPGTYSSALLRQLFMEGPILKLSKLFNDMNKDAVNRLLSDYSIGMKFFGINVAPWAMVLVLIGSIVIFGALILILYSNKKTNFFALGKKHKKKIKLSIKK